MKIETVIEVVPYKQNLMWSSKLVTKEGVVLLEVQSWFFKPSDAELMLHAYESTFVRMMKEITKRKDYQKIMFDLIQRS